MARVFTYVVLRDFGFAPNPFHGICTLATCKPRIRLDATVGDYVLGTATVQRFPPGQVVYAMKVTEAMTFDEYWTNPSFIVKRPALSGSRKWQYGDNIYHRSDDNWIQEDSHHSYIDGLTNAHNLGRDTSVDRVLLSDNYTYWGGNGPEVPAQLRDWNGHDIVTSGRGHKCQFPEDLAKSAAHWLEEVIGHGFQGRPFSW